MDNKHGEGTHSDAIGMGFLLGRKEKRCTVSCSSYDLCLCQGVNQPHAASSLKELSQYC